MCNPVVVMGMAAAGGIYSAAAQRQAGANQEAYYNYLAALNEVQAKEVLRTAGVQTKMIQDSAAIESRNLKNLGRRFEGVQKVAFAANGVPLSSVTAEDVARDTMTKEELDQAALRYNADSKAWETMTAAKQTAQNLTTQGAQFRYAGANAKQAADIGATTSLLGAATHIADTWYDWNKTSTGMSPRKRGNYDYAGDRAYYG